MSNEYTNLIEKSEGGGVGGGALRYEPESRGFDFQRRHWNF
jgi:hypothetical protein